MLCVRALTVTVALLTAAAACSPDSTTAPNNSRGLGSGSADIGNLITDPPLFSQVGNETAAFRVDLPGISSRIADDFVVPAGKTWTLGSVIIGGDMWKPTLPFSIRSDASGKPGAIVAEWTLPPTDSDPQTCCNITDYLFTLAPGLTLSEGTYWLVVETPAMGWQRSSGGGTSPQYASGGGSWFLTGDAGYSFSLFGTDAPTKPTYQFNGFGDPVKNDAVNSVKAGRTIPLNWRITDVTGALITTLTAATISVVDLSCTIGGTANQLEESAAGASGLQNLGNGYYQLNWKTPASYARSCKLLQLDLGEAGGPRTARFEFTK